MSVKTDTPVKQRVEEMYAREDPDVEHEEMAKLTIDKGCSWFCTV